jgi:hypothetical protein
MKDQVLEHPKERVMRRHLRARVQAGRIELLEPFDLPEGSEVDVTVEVPEAPKKLPNVVLRTWNLGLRSRPVTREDAYDDEL